MTRTQTPPKPMNTLIHDAFRRDLRRLDEGFGAFPDRAGPSASQLIAAWSHFAYQLHLHHDDEETGFWPAFRQLGVDGSLVDELQGEHKVMITALDATQAAVDAFASAPSAVNAAVVRAALGELAPTLTDHLAHEERDLNPFSDEHHSTKPVKAAAAAARRMHREGAGAFFSWLADDCGEENLRSLRKEVPMPVLFVLLKTGRRKYQRTIRAAWTVPDVTTAVPVT